MATVGKGLLKANGYEYLCRYAGLDNDGPLVLLLHGFPETSIIWEPLLSKLADLGYRAVAPNQRGYSDGARPEGLEPYSVGVLADDVIGFAEELGCDGKFYLVGHDWGGSVGWAVVNNYPERIQAYVGMSTPYTPAFMYAMMNDEDQKAKSFYIRDFQTPEVPEETMAKDDYAWLRNYWEGFSQEVIDDYLTVFSQKAARTATVNWYRAMFAVKNDFEYKPVELPVTYIWGNQDIALGRLGAEMTAQFMKGYYNFVEVDGGHWLMEFNEEEVSKIIIEHIQKFPME
ncbi:MAG: alpha/beta hydrolase [Clostridia bacterium]|nr:alpha/beta hydrolase [Clostridia bacterium]